MDILFVWCEVYLKKDYWTSFWNFLSTDTRNFRYVCSMYIFKRRYNTSFHPYPHLSFPNLLYWNLSAAREKNPEHCPVTYPEAFWYRYTDMGAQIIGTQIIVKWRKKMVHKYLKTSPLAQIPTKRSFTVFTVFFVILLMEPQCETKLKRVNLINKLYPLCLTWSKIKMAAKGCCNELYGVLNYMVSMESRLYIYIILNHKFIMEDWTIAKPNPASIPWTPYNSPQSTQKKSRSNKQNVLHWWLSWKLGQSLWSLEQTFYWSQQGFCRCFIVDGLLFQALALKIFLIFRKNS